MSDLSARTTGRRALTGDPEDAARALMWRMRGQPTRWKPCSCAGANSTPVERTKDGWECAMCGGSGRVTWETESRLALAAYCGDVAARALVPSAARGYVGLPLDQEAVDRGLLSDWLTLLGQNWPSAPLRASLAAARAALSAWEDSPSNRHHRLGCAHRTYRFGVEAYPCTCANEANQDNRDLRPRWALEAAERHLESPTEETRRKAVDEGDCSPGSEIKFYQGPALILHQGERDNQAPGALAQCVRLTDETTIRAAISATLVKWALSPREDQATA